MQQVVYYLLLAIVWGNAVVELLPLLPHALSRWAITGYSRCVSSAPPVATEEELWEQKGENNILPSGKQMIIINNAK